MLKIGFLYYKSFRIIEILCIIAVCMGLSFNVIKSIITSNETILLFFYFLFCFFSVLITYLLRIFLIKNHIIVRMLFMMTFVFIIRVIVYYYIHLTQYGDYGSYLSVAKSIADGQMKPSLYYGIFPHALNYSIFLSIFYKLFGSLYILPPALNLFFGVIEMGLVIGVAEMCAGPRFGLIVGIVTLLNPSIIIFTLFAGGEPIYDSLIMGALFCFIKSNREKCRMTIAWLLGAGALCGLADFFRPTGIIFILAVIINLIIFDKKSFRLRLTAAFTIVVVFVVIIFMLGIITSAISGYKKPSLGFGWNLFVGGNQESNGRWNAKDAAIFKEIIKKYNDPLKIQTYFAYKGIERYNKMHESIFKHLANKLNVWFDESFTYRAVTEWQNQYTRFKSADIPEVYHLICFYYNFIIIILAIVSMIFSGFSKKIPSGIKIVVLYMLGSIFIFMILETTSRYKGAYYCMFTFLASYGLIIIRSELQANTGFKKLVSQS